jgi:glycerol-3-phosphate acyltransferase PlsY
MNYNYIILAVAAYLLGNFSTSYIVSMKSARIDIRQHGSGNAGATNVLRVLGVKSAAITFLGDGIKGALAVLIGGYFLGSYGEAIAGICVVIGHNWPIILKFKGGKGIASTMGVMLAVAPLIALISIIGLLIVLTTKYVSLASVSGMCILPISLYFFNQPNEYFWLGLVLAALAVFRHTGNIQRLLNGTEAKLGQRSKLK